jgi:hypothetical protein
MARCDGRFAAVCTTVTAPDREAVTRHSAGSPRSGAPWVFGPPVGSANPNGVLQIDFGRQKQFPVSGVTFPHASAQ